MDPKLLMEAIPKQPVVKAKKEYKATEPGELELFEAVKGRALMYGSLEELTKALKVVMLKVGLSVQNLPNEAETAVLIDHILNNYGKHTVAEIRLAFSMAISGRLNIEERNISCYGNFSCLYFSSIMNAYRDWAKVNYKHEHDTKKVQKIYSDEEILNQRRGQIESAYQAIRSGHLPILHNYFFEVLYADELLAWNKSCAGELCNETVEEFFVRKINSGAENIYIWE